MKNEPQQTLSNDELRALTADQLEEVTGGASGSLQDLLNDKHIRGIPVPPDGVIKLASTKAQQFVDINLEGFPIGVLP